MDDFTKQVYQVVAKIPKGKVTTYHQIAKIAGIPKASRLVGLILSKNPTPIITPCHRVILANGKLGGYLGGFAKKFKLLKEEGIEVENGRVDLRKYGRF